MTFFDPRSPRGSFLSIHATEPPPNFIPNTYRSQMATRRAGIEKCHNIDPP